MNRTEEFNKFAKGIDKEVLKDKNTEWYWARRFMVDYDRVADATIISERFKEPMNVLDYGPGAGDYGLILAEKGHRVSICDFEVMRNLVQFRFANRNIPVQVFNPGDKLPEFDLIIFGEVLDHMEHPLGFVKSLKYKYIYCSSYPFVVHNVDNRGLHEAHTQSAYDEAEEFKNYLKSEHEVERIAGYLCKKK
jgi:2-polyprenyl-3-methyl-5-hydroxy-6-metoxy-1,4-benzoquinol methylase